MSTDPGSIQLALGVRTEKDSTIISAKTNLPPNTVLMATLVSPKNLGGDGTFWQSTKAVKKNQTVQFEPFSKGGKRIPEGSYVLHLGTVGQDMQPQEVQAFFGDKGKNLEGENVKLLPGSSEKVVNRTYRFRIESDGSLKYLYHNAHRSGHLAVALYVHDFLVVPGAMLPAREHLATIKILSFNMPANDTDAKLRRNLVVFSALIVAAAWLGAIQFE